MIPSSTYRLQLHAAFTLEDALRVVPYLAELGIGWLYCSPLSMSRPGSEHGYDVVDPTRIDPELGTLRDLEALVQSLHAHGLGLLLDVVPNHMGTHETNGWWMDVLEHGPASAYARFFDIDWKAGGGKVLLPVLGADLDEVLRNRELSVEVAGGRHWLRYYEQRFPLRNAPEQSAMEGPLDTSARDLLEAQAYRLMRWSARKALNYRRFFEINELIGLRIEDPMVFETVHAALFEWIARGWVDGLRIDHPDGLRDPAAYLRRLQHAAACALVSVPGSDLDDVARDRIYMVVEKILSGAERLRTDWPVHGTTGYEQLNLLGGLFVAPGVSLVQRVYSKFTGDDTPYSEIAYRSKKQVLAERFAVELNRISDQICDILHEAGTIPAFEGRQVNATVLELIACFPVYRSYVTPRDEAVKAEDRELIERAFAEAEQRSNTLPAALLAFLRSILLLQPPLGQGKTQEKSREVLMRFQQLTGPAAAKGVEDTALYQYVPLTCQNEVGGEPKSEGTSIDDFHAANSERMHSWPHALTATSTHDTKRSEDMRQRIAILSEVPESWAAALADFAACNARHKVTVDGVAAPSANDEYLLYQTLLGIWPASRSGITDEFRERISAYALKAAREAKLSTSWTEPNEAYEKALADFVSALLDPGKSSEFLKRFSAFAEPVCVAGRLNSLSQTVLKIGSPGVPDFYQGTELWDLSLVDPDNRRPVDFDERQRLLGQWQDLESDLPEIAADDQGALKFVLVNRGLSLRKRHESLFASGAYLSLKTAGSHAQRVVAFARMHEGVASLFVAGRFFTGLGQRCSGNVWRGTQIELEASLPIGPYRDVVTGRQHTIRNSTLELSDVFDKLPCAMLEYSG